MAACDIDGDLLPELYIANDFGPDRLLWNRSTPNHMRFELVAVVPSAWARLFKGMGVDFGDLNGDGTPDIFVSNITAPLAVQEGQLVFLSTARSAHSAPGERPRIRRRPS